MSSDQSWEASARASLLRFDLAVQRNHLLVYTAGFTAALIGKGLGVFPLRFTAALLLLIVSFSLALVLSMLIARGVSRKITNPIWMVADIAFIGVGIYATGGITSPWYVWYVATAGAAAFAGGRKAAYLVSLGNTVSYLGLLVWMGHIRSFDYNFVLAFSRMLFTFGASWFFLVGVANLQEKRLRVRQLESEAKQKVAELTRLTAELKSRTDELSEANRRIREADRLKSQFLANMSHELRTPMNSIIGFSEILVERLDGKVEPKHQEFLRHILSSGQHLLSIINDVLDLSKIEAGKMEIFQERFQARSVVDSVCTLARGMVRSSATFLVDVPADIEIETDLAKFKQVLFNLLSNAVKFSPAGTPIHVTGRVVRQGEFETLRVEVRDEGIGIDPAHHAMIFQEFRQVDATVRREFGGTGLGLALVKRFVELQGGRVGVESALGSGSTFWFELPLEAQAAVVNSAARIGSGETLVDRVIVVEDDTNAYELISSALASAGYLPVRARHGEEAIRLAHEISPVAITLDLVLPGVDGWEVLKRLKGDEKTRDIPVVIISVVDNRELGVALGADDYFTKPVERDRFVKSIRHITASALKAKPKLLLIDDDPAVHTLFEEELESIGYGVVHAFSGEEGVAAADDDSLDVVVLDLMMPGMSGFEVAGELKQNPATARLPIVVLTSKEITSADRERLSANVQSCVRKGTSAREQLVTEIRRLSARSARSSL